MKYINNGPLGEGQGSQHVLIVGDDELMELICGLQANRISYETSIVKGRAGKLDKPPRPGQQYGTKYTQEDEVFNFGQLSLIAQMLYDMEGNGVIDTVAFTPNRV